LYDFQNNRPIFDYVTDASVGSNSKNGKTSFGGILTKDNAGMKLIVENYRQIRVLENKDSTNIRLGVVVTEI
jgi:hypothetical protein